MPTLSQGLDQLVRRAATMAQEQRSDRATLEYFLLALIDDPDAAAVLRGCDVDLDRLRKAVSLSLQHAREAANARAAPDAKPTASLDRVIRAAMVHASSANLDTVTGAHVLVALFADPVARFLQGQGMSRYDAVGYICHGIRKQAAPAPGEGEASGGPTTGAEAVPAGSTCEVVLLNDIYTPMEFVVSVLQDFFSMTREQAIEIMLSTHRKGVGSCGVYGQVQAHDLARRVTERARKNQHPLRCIVKTS